MVAQPRLRVTTAERAGADFGAEPPVQRLQSVRHVLRGVRPKLLEIQGKSR